MTNSAVWLDREVGEGPGWAAEVVVEPHAGGEGEEFGGDAGSEAVQGSGVVAFEPELVFEGPEDRLDALADRREMGSVSGLVFADGPEDQRPEPLVDGGVEVFAGIALVGEGPQWLGAVQRASGRCGAGLKAPRESARARASRFGPHA